ncbi:MAG: hypothetical protein ABJA62_11095, partial [Luteimonas sp.]
MLKRMLLIGCFAIAAGPVAAQDLDTGDWSFDPGMLVSGGADIVRRAPDRDVDAFFQAVHAAARTPGESEAMCALFDPDADRSLSGLNAALSRFGRASRERFADALAGMLIAASGNPPQAYDAEAAKQV